MAKYPYIETTETDRLVYGMKKNGIRVMAVCAVLAVFLLLVSCSGIPSVKEASATDSKSETVDETTGLVIFKLDSDTEQKVSTFEWYGDTFVLPCLSGEFINVGYNTWTDWTDSELRLEIYSVRYMKRYGIYTIDTGGEGRLSVGVVNPYGEETLLTETMVYGAEIITGDGAEWEYMGLTPDAKPNDVIEAFNGILEFKTLEGEDSYRLLHEDRDRLISFYWKNGAEKGITQLILEIYPDGKYRDCERNQNYVFPEQLYETETVKQE